MPIRPPSSPNVYPDRPTPRLDSARTFLVAASHTCRMRGARPHCSVHSQRGEGAREQGRIAFSFFASFSLSLSVCPSLEGRTRDILLEATANRLEPLLPSRMSVRTPDSFFAPAATAVGRTMTAAAVRASDLSIIHRRTPLPPWVGRCESEPLPSLSSAKIQARPLSPYRAAPSLLW